MKWLMMWQLIVIDISYIIILTTITGSIFTIGWFLAGRILGERGYLKVRHQLLKIVLASYLIPVVYGIIKIYKHFIYDEALMEPTPAIYHLSIILDIVWILVSLVLIIINIHNYYIFRRNMIRASIYDYAAENMLSKVERRLHIRHGRVKLMQSYAAKVPQIMGVIHPVIFLPVQKYSEKDLEIILIHEMTHYQQQDLKLKLMMSVVKALHFFNPLVRKLGRELQKCSEAACDSRAYVLTGMSSYFNVILNLKEECSKKSMAVCLMERKDELMERIEYAKKINKNKKITKCAAGLMVFGMLFINCATVFGATVGLKEAYRVAYEKTEPAPVWDGPTAELEEHVIYADEQDDVVEVVGEVNQMAKSSSEFNWTILRNLSTRTTPVYIEAGQSVVIAVLISPDDRSVNFGIKDSKGNRVYVTGIDEASHIFNIEESGYYCIYAENPNNVTVVVDGCYVIK